MADYSDIRGYRVKYLSSDPTLNTSTEGQVWYNSTSGTLKSLVQIKAWSAGGNLSTARYGGAPSTSGTQTATFYAGGANVPGAPTAGLTEEYNGYSWSSGGTLPPASPSATRDGMGGAGTLTAGLAFSGAPPLAGLTDTDEYDGSTWTAANPFNTARYNVKGTGTQTAGLMMGGFSYPPSTNYNNTEEYDGTSWTAGGTLATATRGMGASGLQTAGLAYGGETPTTVATSQEYDGTSWTIGNSLNTARNGITGFGIQTNSIAAFGGPGQKTDTEQYDGTTWITITSATNGRRQAGGSGSAVAGLGFGGYASASQLTATEEFNSNINVITKAAWASGGNLNSPRLNGGQGIGTQTAGAIFGGNTTSITYPYVTSTEQYDGSTWTSGGTRSVGTSDAGAFGTLTAGVAYGGYNYPPNVSIANTEEYDGSAWTSGGNLGTSRYASGGAGILTAGLAIGGQNRPNPSPVRQSSVEVYDGTSWSAGTALPTATNSMASGGTQTAAIIAGGSDPSGPTIAKSYSWNGSVWTTNPNIGTSRYKAFGSGGPTSSSSWIIAAGNVPPATTAVELWDGTGFSSHASLSTARNQHMNGSYGNTNSQAFVAGGTPPATGLNNTEEYSGGTETVTASTLTTS